MFYEQPKAGAMILDDRPRCHYLAPLVVATVARRWPSGPRDDVQHPRLITPHPRSGERNYGQTAPVIEGFPTRRSYRRQTVAVGHRSRDIVL